jgi:hypothetical protein
LEALATLSREEIVRPRGEVAAADTPWQLDHDYLAGPILRLERERRRWSHFVAVRRKQLRLAPTKLWSNLQQAVIRSLVFINGLPRLPALLLLIALIGGW